MASAYSKLTLSLDTNSAAVQSVCARTVSPVLAHTGGVSSARVAVERLVAAE